MNDAFPYPSQRMPVMARNVVATSQPLAAQAGLEMLRLGGNAVDAAIAAAATLTVVEPTSNGIGSDAFAILWDGEKLQGLNASGRSPRRLSPERFAGQAKMPYRGWDAVTVPGAVGAWVAMNERFGRLPLATVLEPAIRYASDGFLVSPITGRGWASAAKVLGDREDFAAAFLPGGRAPAIGSLWRFQDQADTLASIAETRGESFYRGHLARAIADHARAEGALLDEEDMATHQHDWVTPIRQRIEAPGGEVELHQIPPNGQGLAALLALGILRHTRIAELDSDGTEALHLQIEAMKLALVDAHRYVADPDHLDVAMEALLDDGYLAGRAALIDPDRAGQPGHGKPNEGGTVYLTTADAEGMMVSFIQSNYAGFGSGVVVPGTGISLQNRGAGFTLEPGHPNQVGGGKRPFHTIIPGFLTRGGQPLMSFGLMGGPMQAQGHLQMTLRTAVWGQNVQAASDAPRWQVMEGSKVALEPGFAPAVLEALKGKGHDLLPTGQVPATAFGGAQLIWRVDGGYIAGSDHRKDGQAVGY